MPHDVEHAFLTAEWRWLVMLNWRVSPESLLPYVPAGTVLDSWRGNTWLSLVGFRFLNTRLVGLPILGHRHFPEINLRFYVRGLDGQRAVVFIREIVPRRAIALTARWMYNEPYVTRRMMADAPTHASERPGRVGYRWLHHGRWNSFGVTADGSAAPITEGSGEQFIAEHYWGYTAQRDGSTVEYQVEHPPWRVWRASDVTFDVDVGAEYGGELAEQMRVPPATAFLADGSAVRVGKPRRLSQSPPR